MPSDIPNDLPILAKTAQFQKSLIEWYDANARDLPWRAEVSLYRTVVSEFMLQQTQIKTALPYYEKWLERFPDFETLADSSEADVLKRWEGLGYYSRARNLQKLAKEIVALDAIPSDASSWLAFPGVGPYAAAAICSIVFEDPSAVVDGNVVRILSRLASDDSSFKNSSHAAKKYQPLATRILNAKRPGDHNQAMMELGATLCLKAKPQCLLCPVNDLCEGRRSGIQETLPRLEKTVYETQTIERAWINENDRVLIHLIPKGAKRMKGLCEFPTLEQLGLSIPTDPPIIERKRSITKYRITERFHKIARSALKKPHIEDCKFVALAELDTLAFSGPHRRWLAELRASSQ